MTRYIIVSLAGGVLFGLMDGLINANPWATRLLEGYKPIAKSAINAPAGIVIDLAYGFILAGIFLLLYVSLPGEARLAKGISLCALGLVLPGRDVCCFNLDDVYRASANIALHIAHWAW